METKVCYPYLLVSIERLCTIKVCSVRKLKEILLKFCRLVKSASEGENVVPIPRNSQTVWNSKFRNNMENSSYRRGDCGCFPDRRLEGYVYKKGIQYFLERHADITRLQEESQT